MREPSAVDQQAPRELLKHVSALDGVRGVAVLAVLLYHLLWSSPETGNRLLNIVTKVRAAGWIGVDLFFALSGFLITGILFDSLQDPRFFRNFYGRRILRIFPLFYGFVILLFLLDPIHNYRESQTFALLLAYLQNTHRWWATAAGTWLLPMSGHLWSLAVEEQFYMIWPIIVFLVRERRKLVWTAFSLALLSIFFRMFLLRQGAGAAVLYHNTFCRADSLLGGAWLALMIRGKWRAKVLQFAMPCFWLGFAGCLVIALRARNFDWESNRSLLDYGFSVLALTNVSLIAMALRQESFVARTLQWSFFRFFGKYSYGLYVLHIPMMGISTRYAEPILKAHLQSKVMFHLAEAMVVLALTIPCALVSFYFYESPFLRLKRYFNYGQGRVTVIP